MGIYNFFILVVFWLHWFNSRFCTRVMLAFSFIVLLNLLSINHIPIDLIPAHDLIHYCLFFKSRRIYFLKYELKCSVIHHYFLNI